MVKKKSTRKSSHTKGHWRVTFTDGATIETGYYPNARMAIGEALSKHKGKVSNVQYVA